MKVSTSILSSNDIGICISRLEKTKTDYIHLDIMDGKFVSNKTWHLDDLVSYLENIEKPLDVHLMVEDIINYVNEFSFLNPEYITFHLEATDDIDNIIRYIKSQGIKVGISIKPNTSVELVYPYLKDIDLVLVMSVEPGMGGQKFIPSSKDKIDKLKEYKINNGLDYVISVDGGINSETIKLVGNSDMVVSGNFITSGDMEKNIELLKDYSAE